MRQLGAQPVSTDLHVFLAENFDDRAAPALDFSNEQVGRCKSFSSGVALLRAHLCAAFQSAVAATVAFVFTGCAQSCVACSNPQLPRNGV